MAAFTVKDRLLVRAMQIEKGGAVDRMIAEFLARRCILYGHHNHT